MKTKLLMTAVFAGCGLWAVSQEITIPYNTPVPMILVEELKEGKNKVGSPAKFVVEEDVKVNGDVAIAKNAPVTGTVTISKKGELRVELSEVTAVDGSRLKLMDCWKFTTAAQNLKSRGAMFVKGTKKNCATADKYVVKKTGGKF